MVKVANSKGYDIAQVGDVIDVSYPSSKTRRGRVGHSVCQTIQCSAVYLVVEGDDKCET